MLCLVPRQAMVGSAQTQPRALRSLLGRFESSYGRHCPRSLPRESLVELSVLDEYTPNNFSTACTDTCQKYRVVGTKRLDTKEYKYNNMQCQSGAASVISNIIYTSLYSQVKYIQPGWAHHQQPREK